jgi:hypothetical protein
VARGRRAVRRRPEPYIEALIEIRHNVRRIISVSEDENGEEEEEDA